MLGGENVKRLFPEFLPRQQMILMVMCKHLLVGLHIEKLAIVWAQEFLSLLRRYCRVAQESEKSDNVMMIMT